MTRTIQYKIEEQHNGKCISMFLKEKEYSRAVIIELKKTKTGIQKNGTWAGVNEILNTGDILEICLTEQGSSENIVPRELQLDILYEDEDILVVNKPYDTPIHPSVNNYNNTLANGVVHYYQQQNKPYIFRCINRLDRDTTGVTILAKNLISASILSKRMKERGLSRIYVAFVEGITKEEGTIDLPIGREEGTIIKRKIDEKEGKHAVTHYCKLEELQVEGKAVSVVALQLETGRTHQIRVHMASIGHPLLGDFLYNESNHMLTRQALHAASCAFYHPITGEYKRITAPLPKDMAMLMQRSSNESCDLVAKL
ncbi:RluA family pseudouridine synthase [Zhenhengia yiwuensis]|uniref:RluA family pseudouridine synthase n=1 Tax=Zhenhengia yiwuensis TaxID=2763666 RepID=UPI002A764D1F|nr:RluA family pseudouridine synthase [Zhenhengia yiwuensis]MDY3368281.1 RluA family pseudouridine synthase [Zhenhengia yiwuensis]